MRDLGKGLLGLMVSENFIAKSLEAIVAIHPPLHAEMDEPT